MKKKLFYLGIIFLLICPMTVKAEQQEVTLAKCIDGDTAKFVINGQTKTTRFLAIDTPETVHPTKKVEKYGKEASTYTCNALKRAKKIVLEYDDNSTKTDKYDRTLAWIFVDNKLLQEELVEKGYAKVAYLYGDYKYTSLLQKKEKEAKKKKLRIWSSSTTETEKTTTKKQEKEEFTEILTKIAKKILKKIENML